MEKLLLELAGTSTTTSLISLVISVVTAISFWGIFSKAGKSGWYIFIPVYNMYQVADIGCENPVFWIFLMMSPIIPTLLVVGAALSQSTTLLMVCNVLIIITVIAAIVAECVIMFKLGKAFHQSTVFCIILVILPVICLPILAFGSASLYEYDVPQRGRSIYDYEEPQKGRSIYDYEEK